MDTDVQFFLTENIAMIDVALNDRGIDHGVAFMTGALAALKRVGRITSQEQEQWTFTVRSRVADRKVQIVGLERAARGVAP